MDKQGYLSAYKSVKNDILLFTRRDLYVCSPKDKQRYLSVYKSVKNNILLLDRYRKKLYVRRDG